ncbi:MAG TPA: hypothetical protein VFS43_00335 [Polyangiaceae bacterium]|nr:hypothetical protein [Polyangiaceae bacterium]
MPHPAPRTPPAPAPPPARPRARALAALALAAAAGCGGDFEPPSSLTTLRVLAIKVSPPYGKPGEPVQVEMLHYDGSPRSRGPDGRPRQVQILWLGGCHNPPSDQYAGCFEAIGQALAGLTPEDVAAGGASDVFGLGPAWGFTIPAEIVSRPPPGDGAPAYGLSYVFYVACGGRIEQDPGAQGGLPLRCVDPATGEPLGPDDFVTGYTPIYSYGEVSNAHPIATGLRFQGQLEAAPPLSCADAADCRAEGLGCAPDGRCLPKVPPCTAETLTDCPEYELLVDVDPASAEVDEASRLEGGQIFQESIWANYYSTDGRFTRQATLINDAQEGWVEGQETTWQAPNAPAGVVRFWAVVRDNRGGASWQIRDILVE